MIINYLNNIISDLKGENVEKNIGDNVSWWRNFLNGGKPIDLKNEEEITLTHNYDGIRELDNKLPAWWLNMFYASIVFDVVYILMYHVFEISPLQEEELKIEIAKAESMASNLSSINAENVTLLTSDEDLKEGKEIYETTCAVCHLKDGGGSIGPNFTDEYWILGGGIKNIFKVVSEGGRTGKGMQAWKTNFSPEQIQKVSSFIITLQGTTPANPKDKEGDIIWKK
jgi:cytochrome c oxidase cbb3-type subunit 3